uniref:Uncharacterized protein n=1 Tax=Nelumbo nucifera TaxID=4432 RepID=A0A822YK14_NELNU|nr:TPA_asm: hypothetical protein HUJ06_005174 [Nelumbo nucifera]
MGLEKEDIYIERERGIQISPPPIYHQFVYAAGPSACLQSNSFFILSTHLSKLIMMKFSRANSCSFWLRA